MVIETRASGHNVRRILEACVTCRPHLFYQLDSILLLQEGSSCGEGQGSLLALQPTSGSCDGLWHAREFYYNKKSHESSVPVEPKEPALIFLDAEFQAKVIAYAHRASSHFHTAAQMIREKVLPLLPDLTKELSTFSGECSTRKRIAEAREKSWIPFFAQDLAWGKKDNITWKISEIEGLLKDIQAGETLLHSLPAILESLSAHFLQLSKLKGRDLDAMGYSSLDALRSLLKDRSACHNLFDGMVKMWDLSMMELGTVKLLYPPRTKDHP
jgi:hypothetical protein